MLLDTFTVHLFLFKRECFNCIALKKKKKVCLLEHVGIVARLLSERDLVDSRRFLMLLMKQ